MISPHAIIDPNAHIGNHVHIGPFCVIGPDVIIGDHCWVGPHVIVSGHTRIGRHNQIFQFASIGEKPQDKKYLDEATELIIGDHNIIREGVTIHRGTMQDQGKTIIGDHNLLMAYMHVAHDCVIGNHTVLANNVLLAGHVIIEDHALIGGASAISQFVRVGSHAFVGGHVGVPGKDVPPFIKVTGPKPTPCGLNTIGLQRTGLGDKSISELRQAYKAIYKQNFTAAEAILHMQATADRNPHVKQLVDFVAQSKLGILR